MTSRKLGGLNMSQYSRVERWIINDELVRQSVERKANQSTAVSTSQNLVKNKGQKTTKKKSKSPARSHSSLFPELFGSVDEYLLKPFTFYSEDDDGKHATKEYDTFVSGVFVCSTAAQTVDGPVARLPFRSDCMIMTNTTFGSTTNTAVAVILWVDPLLIQTNMASEYPTDSTNGVVAKSTFRYMIQWRTHLPMTARTVKVVLMDGAVTIRMMSSTTSAEDTADQTTRLSQQIIF